MRICYQGVMPEQVILGNKMSNFIDFTGKKVVIIGASSGIGRQAAIMLASLGAQLILIARREEQLRDTVTALAGSGHGFFTADISKLNEIDFLFKNIKEKYGSIDGLVYCAGTNITLPLLQLKPEKMKATFDVNFFAFVETVRQVTRRGRFNEGMRIVAVSSNAAIRGDKAHTAYSASKAAMNAAIRCMAKELADKGICITAVAPAVTNTEIYKQYATNSGEVGGNESALMKRQYLGLIEPEDIANTIAFLLSPGARMITGITVPVDGGLSTN